jgi:hypothetical protein
VWPGHRGEKSINRDVKKCKTSTCPKAERWGGTDRDKYTPRTTNESTGKNMVTGRCKRTIKIKLIHNTQELSGTGLRARRKSAQSINV